MTGFTKFDNQLLERIITSKFTRRQLKILLLVLRYSIGYQKTYAILKKSDFALAGVSPSAITEELGRLYWHGVIRWDPDKGIIWINRKLDEWTVENIVDSPGKAASIATRNSLKYQWAILQNSKFSLAESERIYKERSRKVEETKETFSSLLQSYFLNVAPLDGQEAAVLLELARAYGSHAVTDAISKVASENDRSFDYFLKVVEAAVKDHQNQLEPRGIQASLENLARRLKPR